MKIKLKFYILISIFIGLLLSNVIMADPTERVARLSLINGDLSLLPAEESQWVYSSINRPLVVGDTLWAGPKASAELELGSAAVWLNNSTSFKILNLTDAAGQFQLLEGSVVISVRYLKPGQTYEIDTPNLALTINKSGYYRINVKGEGDTSTTTVSIKIGTVYVYGQNTSSPLEIEAGNSCRFTGIELQNPVCVTGLTVDKFDKWCLKRENNTLEKTASTHFVSQSVLGYQDLESYGTWQAHSEYGNVWFPDATASDWAPYHDGNWIWLSQWGWTWVDHKPWGFAPFHYGRWIFIDNKWAWKPGPSDVEAIYAPALVVFLETEGDDIAWFPLGPGEIYVPSYPVSSVYFNQINFSNTNISNININQWYNNRNMKFNYKNMNIGNAVTAVPKQAFIQSLPVNKTSIKIPKDVVTKSHPMSFAPIAPSAQSILGSKPVTGIKPPKITNQPVIFKTKPPIQTAPFSKVKDQLIKHPGIPLQPLSTKPIQTAPVQKPLTIKPSAHPIPIQKPAQKKLQPSVQPMPVQHPTKHHIQQPLVQPMPVQHPTKQHIQKPLVQPMPVKHPIKQHIQKPLVQPMPVQHPTKQHIQQPLVQPMPVQHPIKQHIQQPLVQPMPVQHPIKQHIQQTPQPMPMQKQKQKQKNPNGQ